MEYIYVVTNSELGWDCVVDVCVDEDFAIQKYGNKEIYHISTMKVNLKKYIDVKTLSFAVYDDKIMACFRDGEIDNLEELDNFSKVVDSFGNENLKVVFHEHHKYHFIAYLGISDEEFKYSDDMNKLYNEISDHLEENGIVFE